MTGHTPLNVANPLAKNPSGELKYSVTCKFKDCSELKVADPRATRAMVALMDMSAVIGGAASHWGGPAAFAEIMAAIYGFTFNDSIKQNKEHFDCYHVVNDAGHCENGVYALKANYGFADLTVEDLKGFRSIKSPLTGHGEVHCFRKGVFISNGPLGSGLPQAQGLAMADALSGSNRVTVTAISDGASFEGEAKESYAAIPGLAKMGKLAPFVCVISDNNTKLSGRIDEQAFSMAGTFDGLEALGWKVISVPNGNDSQACLTAFEEAVELAKANPKQPVAIHAKTVKGFGVKKTAESASGGHGFPLKKPEELTEFLDEIYNGAEVPAEFTAWQNSLIEWANSKPAGGAKNPENPSEKIQIGVSNAMIDKRKNGQPVISLSSDLPGSTGTAGFQKEFPEASIDLGVAESNMVSAAIGLSKSGYIPFVDTFAQFGVSKGALPLIMSSLSEGPMIAVFSHTGFQDAADGASHQALSYFSMVSSIPNVEVHCLTSSEEAYSLVGQAIDAFAEDRKNGKMPKTYVFFLGRENFLRRQLPADHKYELGKAQIISDTSGDFDKSVALVASGSLLPQAKLAAVELAEKGIGSVVVNPSLINKPDVETLKATLAKTEGRMVTVEDHQLIGGMGAMITHSLAMAGVPMQVRSLGVDGKFGQSAYLALELYQKHGMDSVAIAQAARSFF